ncbi:glycosyltransferase family 4 protein [Paraclostridium sordellii]|uniref:glycosyltransferase family 4 protein n=1 Tax=Paraclostridium sordellii TaxID=1505 RepID=UPI0005DF37CC|nr:glycosyltransferase family 4 protein [Paeniclostridium sordellii]CEP49073.1 group 1 glycosyl transferase family [[Clostridium] sordellii] [Paeniclostridium sordellii]
MKDILIIAHFITTDLEQGNSRFTYLANMVSENNPNNKVEIVTSSFYHTDKKQRNKDLQASIKSKYKITFINEPSYKKNISLRRFYSHYILSKNLKKYLENRKKPDIIYCAVPSLDFAYVATKYAKKNNIKLIIDVQDLWPEAFKMVIGIPYISDLLFKPMEIKANYIYKNADSVVAVSETYLNRALKENDKCMSENSVFLGTDFNYFDKISKTRSIKKTEEEVWLIYIGTLGHSYDLKVVMKSLKIIKDKGINNIKFMVLGDGPLKSVFENYSKELNIDVKFTGRLSYNDVVAYLKASDIAINPITKGSAGSIINKVGDYAAAGLPVLNTQESEEYRKLIEQYECGLNCNNGDALDLSDKILLLYKNKDLANKMGENNRRLGETKFDRKNTYKNIIDIIDA